MGLVNEGVLPEQIRVIPNGIVVEEFSNCSGAAVRMELGVGSRPLVGMVARLVPEKAPENFVQAAALIKQQRPDCMFVMVGTGPLKQRLTDLAQELNLHQEFKFLGYRPDIAAVTAALDVAVLTSCQEGQGLVLLEAMAAGKPLVATAVGGITEVVQPKHTGLLVPPGMPQAVAQAVLQLLEHEEQALAMGRAGQELVRRQFSQAAMAQRQGNMQVEARRLGALRTGHHTDGNLLVLAVLTEKWLTECVLSAIAGWLVEEAQVWRKPQGVRPPSWSAPQEPGL